MGSTDSMPVVSQAKSGVQALNGDNKEALDTQKKFLNTCPAVSQGKSFYHWCYGDSDGARETQKKFLQNLGNAANGIPGIGHAKGAVHYYMNDKEGGDNAMKSASRTVGVIGGGVIGGLVGGPVGAIAGGVAGGVTLDGITTVADSKIHGEYRPAGLVGATQKIVNKDLSSGEAFDVTAGIVCDGVMGYTAGNVANKLRADRNNVKLYRTAPEAEVQQAIKTGKLSPKGPNGEVWVSESIEHSQGFAKNRPYKDASVMKIDVPKAYEQQVKAGAIKQYGSSVEQAARAAQGKGSANLLNSERIAGNSQGHINIGLKGVKNVQAFNDHIIKIGNVSAEGGRSMGNAKGMPAGVFPRRQQQDEESHFEKSHL